MDINKAPEISDVVTLSQSTMPLIVADKVGLKVRAVRQRKAGAVGDVFAMLRASIGSGAKSFQKELLSDVSFSMMPGDRIGLIGANGAGKSTLLTLLNKVAKETSGKLSINGVTHAILNVRVGMKFRATGIENIILNGYRLGYGPRKIRELAEEIVEFSELGEQINEPVNTYSAGMQLRLAFAIATSVQSDILLMDEWVGAGDHNFRKKAQERIMKVLETSKGLMIASHHEQLIRSLCNKVLLLSAGRVQFYGDVDEGYAIFNQSSAQIRKMP